MDYMSTYTFSLYPIRIQLADELGYLLSNVCKYQIPNINKVPNYLKSQLINALHASSLSFAWSQKYQGHQKWLTWKKF